MMLQKTERHSQISLNNKNNKMELFFSTLFFTSKKYYKKTIFKNSARQFMELQSMYRY